MFVRLLAFALLALAAACSGPLPFMSGGKLSGEDRLAPGEWVLDEDFGVVQLETRPEYPYSVNIAYTQLEGRLYIYAGDTETQWVKNMEVNPLVRLRLADVVYTLRAERVSDAVEISRFAEIWNNASMFHRDPLELDEVWLFQLVEP
jgi:hypothetical protein